MSFFHMSKLFIQILRLDFFHIGLRIFNKISIKPFCDTPCYTVREKEKHVPVWKLRAANVRSQMSNFDSFEIEQNSSRRKEQEERNCLRDKG